MPWPDQRMKNPSSGRKQDEKCHRPAIISPCTKAEIRIFGLYRKNFSAVFVKWANIAFPWNKIPAFTLIPIQFSQPPPA